VSEPIARCSGVVVQFGDGPSRVRALDRVDFEAAPEERVALRGRSGSGKTTLLHVLGGLVEPSEGSVEIEGRALGSLDDEVRRELRASSVAYVFQGSNLLPTFTAFENVAFAANARGNGDASRFAPLTLLQLVGLASKADHLPSELSGGEAQRVALARAVAQRPKLMLCDEPTGQLDSDTGERVLDLVDALQDVFGFTLVAATHDEDVARRFERIVELEDGRVLAGAA